MCRRWPQLPAPPHRAPGARGGGPSGGVQVRLPASPQGEAQDMSPRRCFATQFPLIKKQRLPMTPPFPRRTCLPGGYPSTLHPAAARPPQLHRALAVSWSLSSLCPEHPQATGRPLGPRGSGRMGVWSSTPTSPATTTSPVVSVGSRATSGERRPSARPGSWPCVQPGRSLGCCDPSTCWPVSRLGCGPPGPPRKALGSPGGGPGLTLLQFGGGVALKPSPTGTPGATLVVRTAPPALSSG